MLSIGASVGVAVMPANAIEDEVLRNSDLALSQAKQDGRATYRFFAPAMNDLMQERHRLEVDLRRALALREFALVYQPQVNLKSMRVNGFEALLRWHNPARGIVSPADFIPLAEEIGVRADRGIGHPHGMSGGGPLAVTVECRRKRVCRPSSAAPLWSPRLYRLWPRAGSIRAAWRWKSPRACC